MFCFDEETTQCLQKLGNDIRVLGRNREDFSKVDFPYVESLAVLLINLSTLRTSFSQFPRDCEVLLKGALKDPRIRASEMQRNRGE